MPRSIGVVNILALVVWASLVVCLPLGLISLFVEGRFEIVSAVTHMKWLFAGAVFYLAYPATVFGYTIWSGLIRRYPAATVAPISLLVPVFGLACASAFLGEPLSFWKIGAALLVLLGLVVNIFGPRLRKAIRI